MRKRLLAIIATAAMLVAMVPSMVFAAPTSVATLEELQSALSNDSVTEITVANTINIPAGETVTLDLKGKTVSMKQTNDVSKNHEMIHNYGDLTIKDTVGGGVLNYEYTGANIGTSYSANTVTSDAGSKLIVKSGTIENLTYDSATIAYAVDGLTNGSAGDVEINIGGGAITSKRQAVRIFANSTTNTGTLNISGGDIIGRVIVQNANASANKAALSITGGTFNANSYKTDVLYVGGNNGATIDMQPTVSGGTFNGGITSSMSVEFITGGIFSSDVSNFVVSGYEQDSTGKVIDPNVPTTGGQDTSKPQASPATGDNSMAPIAAAGLALAAMAAAVATRRRTN